MTYMSTIINIELRMQNIQNGLNMIIGHMLMWKQKNISDQKTAMNLM